MSAVLIDTVVFSNFAYTNSVETLIDTIHKPMTTAKVVSELEDGYADGYDFLENALTHIEPSSQLITSKDHPIRLHTINEEPSEIPPIQVLYQELDSGEASLLHASIRLDGDSELHKIDLDSGLHTSNSRVPVATDDLDARDMAPEFNIPTSGSLGILAKSVKSGEVSLDIADEWLELWIEGNGYRSPIDSIDEIL